MSENPSHEAIQAAEHILMRCALRALMESHPNPVELRKSWDHKVSMMWRDAAAMIGQNPEIAADVQTAMRMSLPVWESYIGPVA